MNKLLFILVIMFSCLCGIAQRVKTPPIQSQSLVRFTENKNQWDQIISHKALLDGGALFVEKTGKLTFHLYDKDNFRARHLGKTISPNLKFHSYSIDFIGSNTTPNIISDNITDDYTNFFIGKTSANWSSNVHNYKTITVAGLYSNIDAVYSGGSQSIKYNFIVKPKGNPNDIKVHYVGVKNIKLKNSELYISTSVSESIEQKPFVYQIIGEDTIEVPSKFALQNNIVSFKLLGEYDHNKELIIDPLLVFAASSGSVADNFGMTATYDSRGSLYSGGTAFNVGYPTTVGAYDVSFNDIFASGQTDVVITKYDSSGTFLKYSTYLGGNDAEIVTSLIVDKNDNLCLYGATGSSDFPTTIGCYDNTFNSGTYLSFVFNGTTFNNGTDIYVAKLNSNGNTLMASTYIGGSENDGVNYNNAITSYTSPYGNVTEYPPDSLQYNYGDQYRGEIQIDTLDNVYIYSSTKSSDFPTLNAIDNTLGGKQDAVLVKFNPTLSGLAFSTYIGGSDNDAGYALALDDTLNIYITGGTRSSDFPTTTGSYKTVYGGGKCDGYICKIKQNGSSILHSSFIGTNSYDQSYFVQLDNQQNVYLFGQSLGNMPVTAGVYSNANSKQYIQKLNAQLNTLLASTVFGNGNGTINISPSAFSVDCAGNIYLSGWGGNIIFLNPTFSMPLTGSAIQSSTDGYNFYLMVLGPNMSNILFGSYFGGALSHEHVDGGTSRFDKKGIIYQSVCAGCGGNDDFPVTPGAWPGTPGNPNHNTNNNNCNNGVFKIDFQLNSAVANISASTISGCQPLTVNFTNNSTPGHGYLWDFGANDTTSIVFNPIKTFTAAGTYTANLYVKTSICNNNYDTAKIIITVHPKPISSFTMSVDSCSNNVSFINQTAPISTPSKWYLNSSLISTSQNTNYSFLSAGTYTVKLISQTSFGCKDSVSNTIVVPVDSTSINQPPPKCPNQSFSLLAQGGISYSWLPTNGLSNALIANPTSTVQTSTVYSVNITQNSLFGKTCVKTLTTQVTVNPPIISNFNFTVVPCTDTVKFINTSTTSAPTQSISWQFGGGQTTSTSTAITQTYTNGSYSVTLVAINSFGCKDSVTKPISVFHFTPGLIVGDTICQGFTSTLNASGGTSYTWSPASAVSNSIIATPISTPSITTIYTVVIENNTLGNTCSKTLTTSIVVHPKITTAYTYSVGACSNDVQFTDSSFNNPVGWIWDFGNTSNSATQNPLYFYPTSGTYTTSLISINIFGCKDTSSQIIILPAFTPISINSSILKCELDTVQLTATGGVLYDWKPAQTLSNSSVFNPLAFPSTTTIYTVTISTLKGLDTCKSTLTTTVNVFPFSYNTSSITVSPATLTLGQSSNVTLNGLPINSTITVVPDAHVAITGNNAFAVTPTKSGEYTIYATDANNCKHALKTIYVEVITNVCNESVVYLPTGFTPNNDGTNDVLYIRSNFVTDVYLTIYDRWGEKLFETNDIKKGWDGTYKGKQLDQGVYGYYMTFTCNNGEQSFKKGNITLMK